MTAPTILVTTSLDGTTAAPDARDEVSRVLHDMNNLLAIIVGNADALDVTLPPTVTDRSAVQAIRDAAEAVAVLGDRLGALGGPVAPPVAAEGSTAIDVADVVQTACAAVGQRLRTQLTVTVIPAPRLWTASVDATLLDDTLTALVSQAADALPHGATVRVRMANAEIGVSRPHLVGSVRRLRYVGIDIALPESAARLGLAVPSTSAPPASTSDVCLAAIVARGGRVSVETDGVSATLVSVLLPSDGIEAVPASTSARGRARADTITGSTVVVLDHDGARRALLHKILRVQGHHVVPAATSADLAAALAEHCVALVIADRPAAVAGAAGAVPGGTTRHVIYTGRAGVPEDAFGGGVPVTALPTPFGARQLVAAVRTVLGACRDGAVAQATVFKDGAVGPIPTEERG